MKATAFALGNYTSSKTGNVSSKIVVKFDNATEQLLWCNLAEFKDKTVEECVTLIKANRDSYLNRVIVTEARNYPGNYPAQFSSIEVEEEF